MDDRRIHKITIIGKGTYSIEHGANLGYFLASKNLIILPCSGNGLCGLCRVTVKGGVSDPTGNEIARGIKWREGVRLACQTRVLGDVVVKVIQQPIRETVIPPYSLFVKVEKPKPLFNVLSINEINRAYSTVVLDNIDIHDKYFVSYMDHIISSFKSVSDPRILLVDLGTTKIEYEFIDLKSNIVDHGIRVNPLNPYGLDIISRLSKALESSSNRVEMTEKLVNSIKDLSSNKVIGCLLAGNTVMESLFAGLPLHSLAVKPFQPIIKGPFIKYISVGDRKIPCLLMPFISGFVGGDAFSDLVLTEYMKLPKPYMIIDLGANTEILLVTSNEQGESIVYVTSTPAGPAFEGHLSSGSSIDVGGITSVRIKGFDEKGRPLFEYRGRPMGLTGSGVVSLVVELLKHKLISSNGRFLKGYEVINGIKSYRITSNSYGDIVFTQKDLREFQKALASVKTGWRILLKKANISPNDIRMVVLSGRFGSSMDPNDVIYLGMVPVREIGKILVGGNTVLSGLYISALDREFFKGVVLLLKRVKHVNLAEEKEFMNLWIKSLELEHYE